ncbi:MAG: hypothetical protein WCI06_07950 [Methylococcaceae bacterium]
MNTLKKIALVALVAASFGAVSTTAFAETDAGRIVYAPAQSIDMLNGKIQIAIDALTSGSEPDAVSKLVKEASDFTKEVNASDIVARTVSKGTNLLKAARKDLQDGASQQAETKLRDAQKVMTEAKGLI